MMTYGKNFSDTLIPNVISGGQVLILYEARVSSRTTFIALVSTISVLIALGIIANVVVCVVMHRTKATRKNLSNFFIFCLALLEVIFRVVIFPLQVLAKLPKEVSFSAPTAVCKLTSFLSGAWCSAVFCSTVIIALDRYQNIVSPLKSRTQKKNPFFILIALFLYVVVFSTPFLFSSSWINIAELPEVSDSLVNYLGNKTMVVCDLSRDWRGQFSTTVYFVFSFLVPILVISTAYARIVMCLSKRANSHRVQNAATKSKLKAVRMLVLMVLGFVLCWGPTNVLSMLRSYHVLDEESYDVTAFITMVAEIVMYCSSVINPLLYAYYNGDFRKQVSRSCGKYTCSQCVKLPASMLEENVAMPMTKSTPKNYSDDSKRFQPAH